MKRFRAVLIMSFAFFWVITLFYAPQAFCGKKIYRLKIQSAYPRGDLSMQALKYFAADAKKKSDGRLLISVYADPELVPAEQLFDATSHGTIDMLQGLGAMWAGVIPVGEVEFGLPYQYRTPGKSFRESAEEIRKLFYDSGMVELLRKEYAKHGLYWLDMHSYGPNIILSTKPINSCSDFKGMKITVEGAFNQFYDDLGASGAIVSGTETYMALKLGTVDAAQWDVSAITALKWYKVAPYWIKGGENHQSFGHILVNLKKWNALPDDLKKDLHKSAFDYWNKLLDIYDGQLKEANNLVKEGKLKVCDPDCKKEYLAAAEKIWDSVASKDPACAKAIKIIKKWRGISE
jgi:TRAP-type C4-dicarboxylate transport system substrate-binding protein